MKRLLVAALVSAQLLGLAGAARAEWPPAHRAPVCHADTWKSHRTGPCGWHTVPALIGRVFGSHTPRALCIARRESGLRPRATNGQYRGLFQFGSAWWAGKFNPYNPVLNVLRAYEGSRHGTSWGPWYPLGAC